MSVFLDPRGRSTFGIAICGRCSRKFSLDDLSPDPNSPGLMVCREDLDEFDPYRLPPRPPDQIVLRFTRPDVPLDGYQPPVFAGLALQPIPIEFLMTEDGFVLMPEGIVW